MIATFVVYLALVFLVGLFAERYISKSEEGYYLGDRNFGPVATAISAGATDTSGWIFIGAAGYSYVAGISTMWMLPGFVVGYFINWFVVAPRLRRLGTEYNCLSIPDFFEKRYGSNLLKITSSVIIAIFFIAYMGSQLTAAGKAFHTIIDIDYNTGLIFSAFFVLAYTVFGGYRAVVWTDVIQGFIMIMVLVTFPIYMIIKLGGWESFFAQLGQLDPVLLTPAGGSVGAAAFGIIVGLVGFGLGEPGQPHIIQRFLSAKDDKSIREGTFIAMVWVIIVMMGSNLLGLIGRILTPSLADPEYVFPQLVMETMHPILIGVVLGAIFAAIQSTFSSQLMVATQSLASDLLRSISKREYSNKQVITISRITMVILSILATGLALMDIQAVFTLVLYAWAGLGASFGPLIILALYSNAVTKWGAFWGMISGTVTVVIWKSTPYSVYLYEIIPGMLVSTIVILTVSKWTSVAKRDSIPDEAKTGMINR